MSETQNFVKGPDIGSAWLCALDRVVMGDIPNKHLTIEVTDPVTDMHVPESTDLVEWVPVLNVGDVFDDYCDFDFGDESKVEGTTGRAWIESRIYEMYEGLYHKRLQEPDQIEVITERLKQGNHGSCTNALVAQVYNYEDDLTVAASGKPFAKDMACMTQIQFRPKKQHLHVFATFRSQYIDSKCYGNLIALAMLQSQVCEAANYEPGVLVEHVNNTITYSSSSSRKLLNELLSWDNQGVGLRVAELALERLGIENPEFQDGVWQLYGAYFLNKKRGHSIPAVVGAIITILGDQVDYELNIYKIAEAVNERTANVELARQELQSFYKGVDDATAGP